jgi:uncharacterized membrane protein YeiB
MSQSTASATLSAELEDRPPKARVVGIDVARGIALLAMLAANIFDYLTVHDTPTIAAQTVLGRSATLFVLVAGISLAFITGGRRPPTGAARRPVIAAVAMRALVIATLGLLLGYPHSDLWVILPYYGVFFLLAIPLLGLRPRALAGVVAGLIVVGPVVRLVAYRMDVWDFGDDLALHSLVLEPGNLIAQVLVAGYFPAVVYMAYLLAGLAIGRLDLSSRRVAARLVAGGVAMVTTAWVLSRVLLYRLGGLAKLHAADPEQSATMLRWNPEEPVASWWWLADPAPHSVTPLDALNTLGSAMMVVGLALLVSRLPIARRVLRPVAVVGTMTLTVYSAHVLVLASGVFDDNPAALYLVLVTAALTFAVLWQRCVGQGPLERLVARAAAWARHHAAGPARPSQVHPTRA